jgi:hypothetical protein
MFSLQIKSSFFDREIVKKTVDKQTRQALNRIGGYMRRTARSSIKRKGHARKAPKNVNGAAYQRWLAEVKSRERSLAGSPPFQHTTHPVVNPKNIVYAWDGADSLIVGMIGFPRSTKPVPNQIEFGSQGKVTNARSSTRKVGDGGEIELGREIGGTTKLAAETLLGAVNVSYTLLRTEAQVARANLLNKSLYGPPTFPISTAARPVIGPAFTAGIKKFNDAFGGRISGGS